MRIRFINILGVLFLSSLLLTAGTVVDALAQQDPAVNSEEAATSKVVLTHVEDDSFAYSPMGRRDPFKPLIQKKQKIAKEVNKKSQRIKGPLERFELDQYRLIAIMVVKGTPRAMIKAPDGKGYTVKVGQYIGMNDGKVKKIETKMTGIDKNGLRFEKNPDRIVVEEAGVDSYTGKVVKENRFITM